jgi:uncharacterized membrane protein
MECNSRATTGDTGGSTTTASSGGGGGGCFISSSAPVAPVHGAIVAWFSFILSFCGLGVIILYLWIKKNFSPAFRPSAVRPD